MSTKILAAALLAAALALPLPGLTVQAHAADAAVKAQVESVLRDHPEVLMDVLREHSEELFLIMREGSQKAQRRTVAAQWQADLDVPKNVNLKNRITRGGADAPVTIVAYSDFTCPYCEQAAFTVNSMLKHYGSTLRFVFKNYPLASHEHARTASEYFVAASMQNADKAWQFYDAVFAGRAALTAQGEEFLRFTAEAVGLDVARLTADAKGSAVKAIIDEDIREAQELGFSGTPYFLVNNIVVRGALPFDLFSEAVEMALDHENKKQ